jgi:ABC-type multidrug transport system fused ATPase/permease subunit
VATAFLIQAAVAQIDQSRMALLPAAGVAVLGTAITVLRVRERHDAERLGQAYVASTRQLLLAALLLRRRPGEPLDEQAVLRLSGDLPSVKRWVSHGLARSVAAGLMLSGILLALAAMDRATGVVAAAIVMSAACAELMLTVPLSGAVREARRRSARVTRLMLDQMGGGEIPTRRSSRRFAAAALATVARMRLVGWMEGLPDAASGLLVSGVLLVAASRSPAPDPAAIAGAVFLAGLVTLPLRRLAQAMHAWVSFREARRRIDEVVAEPMCAGRTVGVPPEGQAPGNQP